MINEIFFGIAILVLALIDLKYREIPAFPTTALILAVILIYPQNIVFGIAGFVFGWLLYEFDFTGGRYFGGFADVKVMAVIGMFVTGLLQFYGMMLFTGIAGIGVAVIRHYHYKNKGVKAPDEFPFLPVLLIVYIATVLIGAF